jgi:hypothetical protein
MGLDRSHIAHIAAYWRNMARTAGRDARVFGYHPGVHADLCAFLASRGDDPIEADVARAEASFAVAAE